MLPEWVDIALLVVWLVLLVVRAVGYRRRDASEPEIWMAVGFFWVSYFLLQVTETPPVADVVPMWLVTTLTSFFLLAGCHVAYRVWKRPDRVESATDE